MARTGSMADNFIRRDAMEASIPTMAPGRMRWTHAALLVAGYVLLDWASYIHAMHGLNITPWSPGPALGLAFVMRFGVRVAGLRATTVAGALAEAAGRVPVAGERFLLGGLEFDVLEATPARVERVLVRPGPVTSQPLPQGDA